MSTNLIPERLPESGSEELLTRKELAWRLRRSVGTVDNWRKRERLPSIVKGHTVFFDWQDVRRWLKSGPKEAGPPAAGPKALVP